MAEDGIILASASPRRKELLELCRVPFRIAVSSVDETPLPNESPETMVRRLALAKAEEISVSSPGAWVVGADTTVVLDDEILGKPSGPAEARAMLRRLAGREHTVWGGLALCSGGRNIAVSEAHATAVRFTPLTPGQIDAYVATGEPLDKAGAYAIQGYGGQFVEEIRGSYSNVVGLNVSALLRLLRQAGALV